MRALGIVASAHVVASGGGGAIAIDASTPAPFGGSTANVLSITSASFTAPVGSRILVGVGFDANGAETTTVVDSQGLTWTRKIRNTNLFAELWISSVVPSAVARTVTCSTTGGAGATLIWAKPWVLTGVNATTPTGATGTGTSATNAITPNVYTSTIPNSMAFAVAMDDNVNGVPTSSDVGTGALATGNECWLAVSKAAATPSAGTAVTLNFDAAGSGGALWSWAAVEVLPGP